MKTKNNVQKAILRSVAVVVSFVLLSITVSAQGFWRTLIENSSFNQIALAMVDTENKTETPALPAKSLKAMYVEAETESSLKMERWMINESNFDVPVFQIVQDIDKELEMEDWMLDEGLFQPSDEGEPALELEAWMTSEKVWKI
ncbi:MAG: hypothetical protein ABFS16_12500 [Bacteroidota bacterium]